MIKFDFATAGRILFGQGSLKQLAGIAPEYGRRAFVATGWPLDRTHVITDILQSAGIEASVVAVTGEPSTDQVQSAVIRAKDEHCDFLIGFGGGSAIDTAKAVAALLANGGTPMDYLEVIGKGQPLTKPSAPWIAIPTTSGTGAEVTRNAVLAAHEQRVKVSLRSPYMLPRVALVDPELTLGLPPSVTASTGMDALAQVIEPYVSIKANPFTDAFCREGMRRVAQSLRRAYEHGDDISAREDMALASLMGGLALANAGLGAVHGFAGPVGGMFPAPHGAVCARLLPPVMAMNVSALRERQPDSIALHRYDEIAQILTGSPKARAQDGVTWVSDLCQALNIASLRSYHVTEADLPDLIQKSAIASSMKANPLPLTHDEMRAILQEAL